MCGTGLCQSIAGEQDIAGVYLLGPPGRGGTITKVCLAMVHGVQLRLPHCAFDRVPTPWSSRPVSRSASRAGLMSSASTGNTSLTDCCLQASPVGAGVCHGGALPALPGRCRSAQHICCLQLSSSPRQNPISSPAFIPSHWPCSAARTRYLELQSDSLPRSSSKQQRICACCCCAPA